MVGVWCMVGVWWITTVVIIRPSQPSLAGVGAGAELGNTQRILSEKLATHPQQNKSWLKNTKLGTSKQNSKRANRRAHPSFSGRCLGVCIHIVALKMWDSQHLDAYPKKDVSLVSLAGFDGNCRNMCNFPFCVISRSS